MSEGRPADDSHGELLPAPAGHLPGGAGLRRLLACVDGSVESEAAFALGLTIARACAAPITLMRTLEAGPSSCFVPGTDALGWELARAEAVHYLETLRARLAPPDVTCELQVETGHAASSILAVARAIQADLVLLGRHGMHGGADWNLSGTAAEVVEGASSAVLLLPPAGHAFARMAPLRRVLVPLDGSQRAESALALAIRLAGACAAELVLAHVVPTVELTGNTPLNAEDREFVARLRRRNHGAGERYLRRIAQRLGGPGGRLRTILSDGPVMSTLLELPDRLDVDLVVMAAHGATGSAGWPHGSVAGHMIRNCTHALLIVQDLPATQLEHCAGHGAQPAEAPRLGNAHFRVPH